MKRRFLRQRECELNLDQIECKVSQVPASSGQTVSRPTCVAGGEKPIFSLLCGTKLLRVLIFAVFFTVCQKKVPAKKAVVGALLVSI